MNDNELLIKRLKAGDSSALDEIVAGNMGLVRSIAMRFLDRGTEYEDLIQIGCIGLMRAARSFDFSHGCMFSTYAVPLIIGEIRRFLRDDGMIKISRSLKAQGAAAMRAREQFLSEKGREPTLSELSAVCGIPESLLTSAIEAVSPVRSLSEAVGEGGSALENFISEPDNEIDIATDRIALREAISKLSEFQKRIIELRYFKELSQQKTGALLGITQVKVSREEKKILEILRKSMPS